jgi:hypothetical protein
MKKQIVKNKKLIIIILIVLFVIGGIIIYFLSKNKTNNDNSHKKPDNDIKIQCKNNCNNRGDCETKTGICRCIKGFSGNDCSICDKNCQKNCGQDDGCGTHCNLTYITNPDSSIKWSIITSSGIEYNDYYTNDIFNNGYRNFINGESSPFFNAQIIGNSEKFNLNIINDMAKTGIIQNDNEFILDKTNNYYEDKKSNVKIFPTLCKLCPNCSKKCGQDDGCGTGTNCDTTLITLANPDIKWTLINPTGEKFDNFIIYI